MKKFIFIYLILLILISNNILADKGGRATRTSTISQGCGSCHGNSASSSTQVTFVSGNNIVEPGSTNNYVIRVTSSSNVVSGINIAVKTTITGEENIGTLIAGNGTKELLGELVHSSPKTAQSGSADFDFSWKAPNVPGKYYMRAVGAACNNDDKGSGDSWNWMPVKEVFVKGVELVEPIGLESYCTGKAVNIKWKSAAVDYIKIELSTDGGTTWGITLSNSFNAIGGTYIWNIPSNFPEGNNYKIKITDVNDPSKYSISKNNFSINGLFYIDVNPQSKDICEGDNYTLYVVTRGNNLKYQWRKNGVNILNAKDSVYTIKNAQIGDEGYYGVLISNPCASNTSSVEALVRVRKRPIIKKQPNSVISCEGGNVKFEVEGDGYDIRYQWFKDAVELTNKTSPTLEISSVTKQNEGKYWCVVSGYCTPSKISDTAYLTINAPPKITKEPTSKRVCEKSKVEFEVTATGEQNLYKWYFNNTLLSVPNSNKLTLNSVNQTNIGKYYCEVSNPCGNPVKSSEATLDIDLLPKINSQSSSKTLIVGSKLELFVKLSEKVNSIQWYFNNNPIANANQDTYTIDSVGYENAGEYYCIIKNDCGEVKSLNIKITVVKEQPGPKLTLLNNLIDFGNVFRFNKKDTTITAFIKNTGDANLKISYIELKNNLDLSFAIKELNYPINLAPNESLDLTFSFNPKKLGSYEIPVEITSNSIIDYNLSLKGFGSQFFVTGDKNLSFGFVKVDDIGINKNIQLENMSNYDVTINNAEFNCNLDNPFSIVSPNLPYTIKINERLDLTINFKPKEDATYMCGMNLNFVNPDTSYFVNIIGLGTTDVKIKFSEDIKLFITNDYIEIIDYQSNNIKFIEIINTLGEKIIAQNNINLPHKINISYLSNGLYFLRINDKVLKFLKY